jgi:hypothetical protein
VNDLLRKVQRWLLLLVGLLGIGLGEELLTNLLQISVPNRWLRALLIMLIVGIAYGLAAEVLAPRLNRSIRSVHGAVKPGRGVLAGIAAAIGLLVAIYLGFYFTYR